jgi:RecB family exonuclease
MAKRLESPSSINTFIQCPRKYYYQYIQKLPTKDNIYTIRGNVAHSVLENFFDTDLTDVNLENCEKKFKKILLDLLVKHWQEAEERFATLNLSKDETRFYFEETMFMVMNWANRFIKRLKERTAKNEASLQQAFKELTPIREQEYVSEKHSVRGFIDAIHDHDDQIQIIDYKTSSSFDLKESMMLQLGIYALLYEQKHGLKPNKVGISFLREKLKMVNVTEELIKNAEQQIEAIHAHTSMTEDIYDYPKKISPLCKWRNGQCDFYDYCQKN